MLDDWYEGGIDTEKFGCNVPLLDDAVAGYFEVLPIADPVKDGGTVKMVRLDADL